MQLTESKESFSALFHMIRICMQATNKMKRRAMSSLGAPPDERQKCRTMSLRQTCTYGGYMQFHSTNAG